MVVVNFNDADHTITLIPRFYPSGAIVVELYNEVTRVANEVTNTYATTNGITSIDFSYTFTANQKMQIKITEGVEVVYRGKLIAIDQGTQDYDPTDGLYTYSNI